MRVGDQIAVCSDRDEIEASQYLEFAVMIDTINAVTPEVGDEIDLILSADEGITDCQFRIIDAAAMQAAAR
jgi:hypothetical protein